MHQKNNDIEKLRALAIILVLLWHSSDVFVNRFGLRTPSFGSWTGVDLFFCISGYVITKSLLASHASSPGAFLGAFYTKRIFRIMPSALICISFSLALSFALIRYGGQNFFADTRADALPALLNYADFAYFYKSANNGGTLLGIFWSLSLEEQFYLVIPLLIWGFRRRPEWLAPLLLPLAGWQFCMHREPWQVLAWSLRTDGLIYGVLIAITEKRFPAFFGRITRRFCRFRLWVTYLIVPALVVILAIVGSENSRAVVWLSTGWAAVVGALLVTIGSFDRDLIFNGPMLNKILLWIGSRSFSIYLFHNIALVITKGMNLRFFHVSLQATNPMYYGLLVGGSLFLAGVCETNYRLVETPLREWGQRLARQNFGPKPGPDMHLRGL